MYPDYYEWNKELMKRLESIMSRYEADIEYEHLGLPKDWKGWLLK